MNFIVDAHLPKLICELLKEAGHTAIHTSELPRGNESDDQEILAFAQKDNSVIISKDADFYHSFLLHQTPSKLVAVKTGNLRLKSMRILFQKQTGDIIKLLETHNLVEVYTDRLVAVH